MCHIIRPAVTKIQDHILGITEDAVTALDDKSKVYEVYL